MGNQRQFNPNGGFYEYNYRTLTQYGIFTCNGITSKVVEDVNKVEDHFSLPSYSNTSDMYFKEGVGGAIIQGRYYDVDRKMVLDFDWGHTHVNKTDKGKIIAKFPKGVVHVQPYIEIGGHSKRMNNDARLMTEDEIKKFGKHILHWNPDVKFQ